MLCHSLLWEHRTWSYCHCVNISILTEGASNSLFAQAYGFDAEVVELVVALFPVGHEGSVGH